MSNQSKPKFCFCLAALLMVGGGVADAFDPADQDDTLAVLRHFERTDVPPPFEAGKFEPRLDETVTLIGGTGMLDFAETGYLEYMLQSVYPDRRLSMRNIAWSADTVYRQQRPMFFYTGKGDSREGSLPDIRKKITPGIFVIQFGKMESLEGEAALPEFRKSYDRMLAGLKALSPRLVLLSPVPFFPKGPAAELAEDRNTVLEKYREVIRGLAKDYGALFVDHPDKSRAEAGDWDDDGVGLADHGYRKLTAKFDEELGLSDNPVQWFEISEKSGVLEKIRAKDLLWLQYYRPTNWAFLFGDRQNVPSSRDYRDDDRRWFVEEIQRLPELIHEADEEIWRAAVQ